MEVMRTSWCFDYIIRLRAIRTRDIYVLRAAPAALRPLRLRIDVTSQLPQMA